MAEAEDAMGASDATWIRGGDRLDVAPNIRTPKLFAKLFRHTLLTDVKIILTGS